MCLFRSARYVDVLIIIIIIIFHSVCNLNGYDSRNITFFPNLFQRLSIPKKA
jgi:hypothetical protein